MPAVDALAAAEFMKKLKPLVRQLIEDNAQEATEVAVNSPNPHGPIIGCMQLALAQAATEYLLTTGIPINAAAQATCELINSAMMAWVNSMRPKGATPPAPKPIKSRIILP